MTKIIKFIYWTVLIFTIPICMHFLWFYCLPVPERNISKNLLLSVQPGMTSEQVRSILGEPIRGHGTHGNNIHHYFQNDFITMTEMYTESTWNYCDQSYLKKSLEIYVNFVGNHVKCVVAEDNDLALYLNCENDKFVNDERRLSRFLNR